MKQRYTPLWRSSSSHDEPEDLHLQTQLLSIRKTKLLAFIFAVLAGVAFLGNAYLFLRLRGGEGRRRLQDGLYPEVVPAMPIETITFEEHAIYAAASSNESNAAWDAILPPGRGYIFTPPSASTHPLLQAGESTSVGEIHSVAVFHQLHCLGMLRNVYWTLLDKATFQSPDLEEFAAAHRGNHHVNHCFDYLRQALQCAGDLALEWPRTEKDGRRYSVDGWGVPHLCKSWDSIMEYMDQHHFNASKRTDISGE